MSARTTNPANFLGNDALTPPTSPTAQNGVSVIVNWTATGSTYASGYRVLRATASGGPYTQVKQITPRAETTYTDNPAAGSYYYVIRAYYLNWESANSSEVSATKQATTATGFHDPSNQAAVTSGSGDNNGYQTNPTFAFSDSTFDATDSSSGTNTNTSCSDAGKDRHSFFNYNFGIPTSSTISGIEVELDAWADSATGSPFICVQLSWDGGTTWTTNKSTSTLGTTQARFTLGTAADTWGRTWSASDFSNANFRVRVTDVAASTSRTFHLDWIAVQITYAPPATLGYSAFRSCSANAAVTSSSGDNDGFQTTPGNACASDGAYAVDANSGNGTGTSCTGTDKDRHLFYNYGFTIPTGSTISGVEVRLDSLVDNASTGTPTMCAELSWDGGTSWTAAKQIGTLATNILDIRFLGSPIDTWGRAWSVSDFSNANFRVRVTDIASVTSKTFSLDWVPVQVTYTPP